MAHPVNWPKISFFYPIGNTPPVNLTQDITPEEHADVLLLGSGDCRNILYTIYSEFGVSETRRPDITCCDHEPAVLARNILLLSMLVGGVPVETSWSVFYHLLLSERELSTLFAYCRKLVELSSDDHTWDASEYSFLRFATAHTREELRRHWTLYLEYEAMSAKKRASIKSSLLKKMNAVATEKRAAAATIPRSGGPLFSNLLTVADQLFQSYWTKGISKDTKSKGIPPPHPNPTFKYSRSGDNFNLHYGTLPASAFHLASVVNGGTPTIEAVNDGIRLQFEAWCSAFRSRLKLSTPRLSIRFIVGDALAIPQALSILQATGKCETGVPASAWSGRRITLAEGDYGLAAATQAPSSFNIIDTSNLSDHLGILNILVAVSPLLQDTPSSILYTNMFHGGISTGERSQKLSHLLCSDIVTLGRLLGLLPLQSLSHFSTYCDKHEALLGHILKANKGDSTTHHSIIPWRRPSPTASSPRLPHTIPHCDFAAIDPVDLGDILFSFHLKMFKEERMDLWKEPSPEMLREKSLLHYTRETIAAFAFLVRKNVRTDWEAAMERYLGRVRSDSTLLTGSNYYQDLACQLHNRGLYSHDVFSRYFLEPRVARGSRIRSWGSLPPVACVILKVPRKALKVLEEIPPEDIGSPVLHCESFAANFHNAHSSIHCFFGDFSGPPSTFDDPAVREDPMGWDGSSALMVTFYIPTWILTEDPSTTSIGFGVRSTPATTMLVPKLGLMLRVFSASIHDQEHVRFSAERPGSKGELSALGLLSSPGRPQSTNFTKDLHLERDTTRIRTVRVRRNLSTEAERAALLSGAKVEMTHVSDFVTTVSFDRFTYPFWFPSPTLPNRARLRIARKSHYLEVEGSLRPDFNGGPCSLNPFLVSPTPEGVTLVNIHRVNLNRSPIISIPPRGSRAADAQDAWLLTHLKIGFSKAELEMHSTPERNHQDLIYGLKSKVQGLILQMAHNITKLCVLHVGTEQAAINYRLPDDPFAIILFNHLRFDLPNNNIILDACVIPTSQGHFQQAIDRFGSDMLDFYGMAIPEQERSLWDVFLPSMAERCRTWRHLPSCEYRVKGIPAECATAPFCGCGKGQDVVDILKKTPWQNRAKEAYRVAISPLFTFEDVSITMEGFEGEASTKSGGCAKCGGPGKPNLLACSACKATKYCSRECQKDHWKIHKTSCSKI